MSGLSETKLTRRKLRTAADISRPVLITEAYDIIRQRSLGLSCKMTDRFLGARKGFSRDAARRANRGYAVVDVSLEAKDVFDILLHISPGEFVNSLNFWLSLYVKGEQGKLSEDSVKDLDAAKQVVERVLEKADRASVGLALCFCGDDRDLPRWDVACLPRADRRVRRRIRAIRVRERRQRCQLNEL